MPFRPICGVVVAVLLVVACNRGGPIDVDNPEPLTPEPVMQEPVVPEPVAVQDINVTRVAEPERPPPPLTVLTTVKYEPPTALSMNEVLAVTIHVEVRGSQGAHEVIANFEAPGSMPYERRAKAIDGTAFDTHEIDFVLPVAGTMIPQAGLSGTWSVSIHHDGEKLAVPTFELMR